MLRYLYLAIIGWGMTSGCAEVAPTNPFDPSTPSSQQAVGQFSGLIELLAPCPDASAQEGICAH